MDRQNTAPPEGSDLFFPDGLRNVRYGEVLLVTADDAGVFSAEVWNTLGLGDCPQDAWDELDAEAIAAERGALTALLNGPRYWTLDTIVNLDPDPDRSITTFGRVPMFRPATVVIGTEEPDQSPFVERHVARETIFRFRNGSEVYDLTAPDGRRFVMQSYTLMVDAGLTIDQLPGLGDRIGLPAGWTYAPRTLDADLDVHSADGIATIVQDELLNTYQRVS